MHCSVLILKLTISLVSFHTYISTLEITHLLLKTRIKFMWSIITWCIPIKFCQHTWAYIPQLLLKKFHFFLINVRKYRAQVCSSSILTCFSSLNYTHHTEK